MIALQTLIDNTSPGGRLDLGAKRFDVDTSVRVRRAITIVGAGASIHLAPSTERSMSTLICQGADVSLRGIVTVYGSKPAGHGYDESREAQHAIEIRGAQRFLIDGWRGENAWGDGLAFTRTATGPWCREGTILNWSSNEIGRQQVSLDAIDGLLMDGWRFGIGYRSVFDAEPPGGNWGAKNILCRNGIVTNNPIGPLLASLGKGSDHSVGNIAFEHVDRRHYPLGVIVRPPAGVRRGPISLTNCWSGVRAERTPFIYNNVDGPRMTGVTQPVLQGVSPVSCGFCTDIDLEVDNDFSPTTTPPRIIQS